VSFESKREKNRRGNGKKNDIDQANLLAKCCVCGDPWDRYVGKKKCLTCGVPVLMCEKCMSLKPDKSPGMEMKVRCPLCVEEKITVLASEVEFTANGIRNKVVTARTTLTAVSPATGRTERSVGSETTRKNATMDHDVCQTGKAADSVLKWGGGHAAKKKKSKRRLCQFGANCFRKDCFFYHPEREPCLKKKNTVEE